VKKGRRHVKGSDQEVRLSCAEKSCCSKKIKVEEARVIANLLKTKINKMELELDHAKLTGRLKTGSPNLPNFVRVKAT